MVFDVYRNSNLRLRVFYLIFGILVLYLGAGLAYRQIIKGNDYRQREKRQNHRRILVPGSRFQEGRLRMDKALLELREVAVLMPLLEDTEQ